jgi:hypothetical protein
LKSEVQQTRAKPKRDLIKNPQARTRVTKIFKKTVLLFPEARSKQIGENRLYVEESARIKNTT